MTDETTILHCLFDFYGHVRRTVRVQGARYMFAQLIVGHSGELWRSSLMYLHAT